MPFPQTDAMTVAAAITGNSDAWNQILDDWLVVVLGWCGRMGGPDIDPEDAAHDVFIVAMERLHTLRNHDRFGGWLFGVTRNILRKHRRSAWWHRNVWSKFSADALPANPITRDLDACTLFEAVDSLPKDQREVIILCDVEEYTQAEVAQLLELPIGTVKSRLRLARTRLRRVARKKGLIVDGVEQTNE